MHEFILLADLAPCTSSDDIVCRLELETNVKRKFAKILQYNHGAFNQEKAL